MGFFGGSKPNKTVAVPPMAWTPNVNLAVARPLVLQLINETHRGRPLENVEALALFGRFQEAAGIPVDPHHFAGFMSAHSSEISELPSRPWLWLAANARNAYDTGDDLFVAHAVFWAGAWKKSE